jgi:hypothetical protein
MIFQGIGWMAAMTTATLTLAFNTGNATLHALVAIMRAKYY